MYSAMLACADGAFPRDSACKYKIPMTTFYQRAAGKVAMDCRPGPDPVLSSAEYRLANYLAEMIWSFVPRGNASSIPNS